MMPMKGLKLDAYTLVDLGLRGRFEILRIDLTINNLFDEEYSSSSLFVFLEYYWLLSAGWHHRHASRRRRFLGCALKL